MTEHPYAPQPTTDTAPGTTPEELSANFAGRVNAALDSFLEGQAGTIGEISADAVELVGSIRALVRGGKRLRPLFAFWGFLGAGGDPADPAIVQAGAALELFQAAALIHDDLIDRSDTRRGQPSVHRRFEALHRSREWHRNGGRFGEAAAVLAGDLCLSYSEQLFGTLVPVPPAARAVFDTMRIEVHGRAVPGCAGGVRGPTSGRDAVARARTVVRYKSAKYSVENPVLLGGALAGAPEPLQRAYSEFALPLGEAFQLRDDVLGVFGDPAETGKPAGDDLREGKRTELIAHALLLAGDSDRGFIQERLGAEDLSTEEVGRMCAILRSSGALAATERAISELSGSVSRRWSGCPWPNRCAGRCADSGRRPSAAPPDRPRDATGGGLGPVVGWLPGQGLGAAADFLVRPSAQRLDGRARQGLVRGEQPHEQVLVRVARIDEDGDGALQGIDQVPVLHERRGDGTHALVAEFDAGGHHGALVQQAVDLLDVDAELVGEVGQGQPVGHKFFESAHRSRLPHVGPPMRDTPARADPGIRVLPAGDRVVYIHLSNTRNLSHTSHSDRQPGPGLRAPMRRCRQHDQRIRYMTDSAMTASAPPRVRQAGCSRHGAVAAAAIQQYGTLS